MITLGEYVREAVEKLSDSAFPSNSRATPQDTAPQAGPSTRPATTAAAAFMDAYSAIEAEEGLSDNEMATVGEILRKEPDIGTIYLAMSKPSVRTYFLHARLEEYQRR